MKAPPRILRLFFAWLGYSSVHFAAGRPLRGLAWIAAIFVAILLAFHLPAWAISLIALGQIVDAAVLAPKRERSTGGYALFTLVACCVSVLVAITIRATWVEAFKIPAGSMIPTLQVGDHVFVDKTARHPSRGDVMVFIYPKERDKDFVKRVVAVGGDTIEFRDDGQLVLNGAPVPRVHIGPCEYDDYSEESGAWEKRQCDAWDETIDGHTHRVFLDPSAARRSFPQVTVPADSYFVAGDNRDNSYDSRFWGSVEQPLVKGIVRTIWWSSGPDGVRWNRVDQRVR